MRSVLAPIWHDKPSTAKRCRRLLHDALVYAKASGHAVDVGVADNAVVKAVLGAAKQTIEHHAAVDLCEGQGVYESLVFADDRRKLTRSALRFLMLTAARAGEVNGVVWGEFDLEQRTWTVPASRMKARVEHAVPLSDEAMRVLEEAQRINPSSRYVFGKHKPLSKNTLWAAWKSYERSETVHGFRSTFRQWCQREEVPFAVAEAALAHRDESATVRAYARSDYFEEREKVMQQWGEFAATRAKARAEAKRKRAMRDFRKAKAKHEG